MHEARHVAFALAVDCPRCEHALALAPMQSTACCDECDHEFEIADRLWIGLLRIAEELDERLAARERAIEGQVALAGLHLHYAIWRQAPSCERCGAELEHARVVEGYPHASECPRCGEPAIDFPVPDSIAGAVTAAKQVFVCDPQRFVEVPRRRTWMLRLRGRTPAQRRRALAGARARERRSDA